MIKQKPSKIEKLSVIKSVLNGTYKKPVESKTWFITIQDGVHALEMVFGCNESKVIGNETQYEQWKKDNCNPGDMCFITDYGLYEPLKDYDEALREYEQARKLLPASDTPSKEIRPRETLLIDERSSNGSYKNMETKEDDSYLEYEEVEQVEQVPKARGGSLANYGITWKLTEQEQ